MLLGYSFRVFFLFGFIEGYFVSERVHWDVFTLDFRTTLRFIGFTLTIFSIKNVF